MNVLVTGCAGFIGFHVARALLERGDRVIGVDNFNDAYDPSIKEDRNRILEQYPKYTLHRVNICDREALAKVFTQEKIDKICHLAARAGVLPSISNPFVYEQVNILGTLTVFQVAKEFGVSHVVAASSSSVYGSLQQEVCSEEDNVDQPISLYAATKKSCELMGHCYAHLFGMNVTMLRFFNVYGEFGRPDMMPWIFTENILLGKKIFVNNYGNTWKDYTYIKDIVRGVILSLDIPLSYEVLNLGNHTPVHLKHCIELIEQKTGVKAIIEYREAQVGDVMRSCADVTRAEKLLGWEPQTSMEVGLGRFIDWYKEYRGIDTWSLKQSASLD